MEAYSSSQWQVIQLGTTAINYGLGGGRNSFVRNTARQVTQKGCGISISKGFQFPEKQNKHSSQNQSSLSPKKPLTQLRGPFQLTFL